ncbi:Imm26 family immunity protein [Streptomyces phaeochromogenes]|uniref:Imm26 family immunity protein n=1 Tax=Streptomyces phaeochromogenes TaxID=1923 RepID=UPI00368053DF
MGHAFVKGARCVTPLKRMKGQRRSHYVGDVFALRLENSAYRFGRIVKIGESGPRGRFPGGILAYLYDVHAEAPEPDPGVLTPDRLHFQHEVDEAIGGRPVYGAIPKK